MSEKKNKIIYQEFGTVVDDSLNSSLFSEIPPQKQNLRVEASKSGRKGKTVTVITGFQSSEGTLTKLLKQLKAQCGTGGTLKEQTLEIQGDQRQKIVEILTKLGYKVKISGG